MCELCVAGASCFVKVILLLTLKSTLFALVLQEFNRLLPLQRGLFNLRVMERGREGEPIINEDLSWKSFQMRSRFYVFVFSNEVCASRGGLSSALTFVSLGRVKTERIRTAQRRGRQRAPATSAEWAVLAGNVNSCFLWVLRLQAGVSLSGPPLEHSGGSSVSLRPQPLCSTHSPRRFQQLHISPIQSDTMLTANTTHTHSHTAECVYHFLCASACFICLCCFNPFSCLRKRRFFPLQTEQLVWF